MPEFQPSENVLSVIIPFHNAKAWLRACVKSVADSLRQAGKERFAELVLVDDGSDDGAAVEIAGLTRTIRFTKNRGVAAARQAGLEAAKGDWIAWVDADDTVRANWAATIFSVIDRADAPDVLQFDAEATRPDGTKFTLAYGRSPGFKDPLRFCCDVLKNVRTGCWLWNRVFRRSLFEGLSFVECGGKEDFMAMLSVLPRAESVAYVPDVLYCYRMRAGSLARFSHASDYLGRLDLIGAYLSRLEPPVVRQAAEFGAVIMFADYCRHCGVPKGYRRYLIRNLWKVLLDRETSWREKVKFCLAVAGRSAS